MARLDIERQKELEPERILYACKKLNELGINPIFVSGAKIEFEYKGENIILWAYSGWHTGKSIKDGRGLKNLLKQLT